MTRIPYTYEIVAVGENTMDVLYSNPVHGTVLVGVRIPYAGESKETVIQSFSPAHWWAEQLRPKQAIGVGERGVAELYIPEPESPPEYTEAELLDMWRNSVAISKLQAIRTLKTWGLYDQVVALVEAVGDPLKDAFDHAQEWRRNSPSITGMFSYLTMPNDEPVTESELDQFFREALEFEA